MNLFKNRVITETILNKINKFENKNRVITDKLAKPLEQSKPLLQLTDVLVRDTQGELMQYQRQHIGRTPRDDRGRQWS